MAYTFSINLPNLLDRGLSEAFMAGMAQADVDLSWAGIRPWNNVTYDAAMYAPPSMYAAGVEGQDIVTESLDETYTQTMRVAGYNLGYSVSWETKQSLDPTVLGEAYRTIGALGPRFFALQCYALLNGCVTTTLTSDGVVLGSAAHPSLAGNLSNFANANLTPANYEVAHQMLRNQRDHRGTIASGRATTLIVPTGLEATGLQILGSDWSAADDRTAINVRKNAARVIAAPELTSTTRWFLLDEMQSTFRTPVLRGPSPWVINEDTRSLNYEARDKISMATGVIDWRGVIVG